MVKIELDKIVSLCTGGIMKLVIRVISITGVHVLNLTWRFSIR